MLNLGLNPSFTSFMKNTKIWFQNIAKHVSSLLRMYIHRFKLWGLHFFILFYSFIYFLFWVLFLGLLGVINEGFLRPAKCNPALHWEPFIDFIPNLAFWVYFILSLFLYVLINSIILPSINPFNSFFIPKHLHCMKLPC